MNNMGDQLLKSSLHHGGSFDGNCLESRHEWLPSSGGSDFRINAGSGRTEDDLIAPGGNSTHSGYINIVSVLFRVWRRQRCLPFQAGMAVPKRTRKLQLRLSQAGEWPHPLHAS